MRGGVVAAEAAAEKAKVEVVVFESMTGKTGIAVVIAAVSALAKPKFA